MSSAEREKLLQTIRGMGDEEKAEALKVIPSDLLFAELQIRHNRIKKMIEQIVEVTNREDSER